MKKNGLLLFLLLLSPMLFAQRINVVFTQAGITCRGSAGGDYFVLQAPGHPLCTFDYDVRQNGSTYVMSVYNPRQRGFVPATYYLYQDGTMHVVANGERYSGYWSYEEKQETSSSNPSFKGKRGSCNIRKHNCPGYYDGNGDNYCDYCYKNGYKCHAVDHQPK